MKPIIAIPVTLLICYRAYAKKSLTLGGTFAAMLTAFAHAAHPWNMPFVLLMVFFFAGTRATRVKEQVKATITLSAKGSYGGEGPRTHVQVLANSIVASVLSLLHSYQLHQRKAALIASPTTLPTSSNSLCYSWGGDLLVVGIIANYVCVAADTFSSELGILAKAEPRLITSLTLRKVPRGTNGGVTLLGLAAGLVGSMTIVAAAVLFLPFCTDQSAGKLGGGEAGWTDSQRRLLMVGLAGWGVLGSLLDSFLGGLFQRSVRDLRSGKIVEGEGGERVLVSVTAAEPNGSEQLPDQVVDVKAKAVDSEGKAVLEKHEVVVDESKPGLDAAGGKHRQISIGDERASRTVENGWDLLDNNDVNFLMAMMMSLGAMAVASWYWDIPLIQVIGA